MKQIVQNPGGRRYFGEDFMNPQEEILLSLIEPFLAELGQFVFCGCKLNNNTISQGVVVLNGKACKFDGPAPSISTPYYVRYATKQENVQYKTGVDVGYITYLAEPCQATDAGAFRLDNAARFVDVFKPAKATRADSAANADNANAVGGRSSSQLLHNSYLTSSSNIDTIADNGVYRISSESVGGTFPDVAQKLGCTLFHTEYDINSGYQLLFSIGRSRIWYREKTGGAYKAWSNIADGGNAAMLSGVVVTDILSYKGSLVSNANADTLSSGYYSLQLGNGTNNTNFPEIGMYGMMLVYRDNLFGFQQVTRHELNINYCRTWYTNTGWTPWVKVNDGGNALTLEGKKATDFVSYEPNGDIVSFKTS